METIIRSIVHTHNLKTQIPDEIDGPVKEEVQMLYPLVENVIKTKLTVHERVHFNA